jgi:signal peptidase II
MAVVIAADQTTKTWAEDRLRRGPIHLFGPVSFQLVLNPGFAFGLGAGTVEYVEIFGAAAVTLFVLWRFHSATASRLGAVSLGLILGGALSNLADRVLRNNHGAVIDFIHIGFWPTFNLADSAITVGAILLAIELMRRSGDRSTPASGA